jgi:hypothetical protein
VKLGRPPWSADAVNDALSQGLEVDGRNPRQYAQYEADVPLLAGRGRNSPCCTAEAHAARGHPHRDDVYGDVVTDEMVQAHSKVVRLAIPHGN